MGKVLRHSLKARIMETQQLAVTRQQSVNNNRGMVFSVQSMPMAVHATIALQQRNSAFYVAYAEMLQAGQFRSS
jgi:hypothetical protein